VGPTCTTSWLNVDPAEPVLGGHHAADGSGRIVMHDMVVCDPRVGEGAFSISGFEINLTLTSADSKVHDQVFASPEVTGRCSCGSGKRFEKCHGKPFDRRKFSRMLDESRRRPDGH